MGASGLVAKGAPPVPGWITIIRYAIVGLSVIILALAAWSIAIFGSSGGLYAATSGGMVIFVCVWTWLVYGGSIALDLFAPHLFYRIVFLIGYVFAVIFWLSAWAWSATLASFWLSFSSVYGTTADPVTQEGSALAGCAGLGAVVWVLSILHLAFFIKGAIRDGGNQQAELGNIKHDQGGPSAYPPVSYATPGAGGPVGAPYGGPTGPSPYPQAQPGYGPQ